MSTLYDPRVHHRSAMRLQSWDYTWAGWYYVTICVQDRRAELGTIDEGEVRLSRSGEVARESWLWLAQHHEWVEVDEFVVMPNHLHGIVILNVRRGGSRTAPTDGFVKSLGRLIGAFKTISTKQINLMHGTPGARFWQRSFYDHVIRNEADLHRIRTYIRHNPAQWEIDGENPARRCRSRAKRESLSRADRQSLKDLARSRTQ